MSNQRHLSDVGIGADGASHALRLAGKGLARAVNTGVLAALLILIVPFFVATNAGERSLAFHAVWAKVMLVVDDEAEITWQEKEVSAQRFLAAIDKREDVRAQVGHVKRVGWILFAIALPIIAAVATMVAWLAAFMGESFRRDRHRQGVEDLLPNAADYNGLARMRRRGVERGPNKLGQFLLSFLS